MKYILKTDMKTKMADLAQYRELKSDISHMESKLDVYREQITARVSKREDLYKPVYGCFQVSCSVDDMDRKAGQAKKYKLTCPNFRQLTNASEIPTACNRCPKGNNRVQYQNLKFHLDIQRNLLKSFWANKFHNAK